MNKLPYINLRKVTSSLLSVDSCGTRLEEALFQFVVYTNQKQELKRICNEIKVLYNCATVECTSRNITSILYDGQQIYEPIPGIHQAIINFELILQKERNTIFSSSGETYGAALRNRFLEAHTLNAMVEGNLFLSPYAKEGLRPNQPFIVLESENEEHISWDQCGKQMLNTDLTFAVYFSRAEDVELIKEEFMNSFDYCNLNIDDRVFCSLEWKSDELNEMEPGYWRGAINYDLITET